MYDGGEHKFEENVVIKKHSCYTGIKILTPLQSHFSTSPLFNNLLTWGKKYLWTGSQS